MSKSENIFSALLSAIVPTAAIAGVTPIAVKLSDEEHVSLHTIYTLSKKRDKFALLYLAQFLFDSHNIFQLRTQDSQKYTVKILCQLTINDELASPEN